MSSVTNDYLHIFIVATAALCRPVKNTKTSNEDTTSTTYFWEQQLESHRPRLSDINQMHNTSTVHNVINRGEVISVNSAGQHCIHFVTSTDFTSIRGRCVGKKKNNKKEYIPHKMFNDAPSSSKIASSNETTSCFKHLVT